MLSQWINYRKGLRVETIVKGDYEGIQTMHFWFGQSGRKHGQTTLPQMIMVQEVIPWKENQACCYHDNPCSG